MPELFQIQMFDFPEVRKGKVDWDFTLAELKRPGPLHWILSAKWASKEIDCTLHGITREGGCGARCCKGTYFWPAKLSGTGACANLGPQGCILGNSKPITCLLYPFYPQRNNLVVYGRALVTSCRACYRTGGRSIAENNHANFELLFGQAVANSIVENTRAGISTTIPVPDSIRQALALEMEQEAAGLMPAPSVHLL